MIVIEHEKNRVNAYLIFNLWICTSEENTDIVESYEVTLFVE